MSTNLPAKYANSSWVKGIVKKAESANAIAARTRGELKDVKSGRGVLLSTGTMSIPTAGLIGTLDGAVEEEAGSGTVAGIAGVTLTVAAVLTNNAHVGHAAVGATDAAAALLGRRAGRSIRMKLSQS